MSPDALPGPSSVRSLRALQKRGAILDGARSEFLRHGYAATSMDRIADCAQRPPAPRQSALAPRRSARGAVHLG